MHWQHNVSWKFFVNMKEILKLVKECRAFLLLKKYDQVIDRINQFPELKHFHHKDDSLIFFAYLAGPEAVVKMVESGVNPDVPDSCNGTILSYYAANNNAEMVEFLLRNGANPNNIETNGETPFSWACARNSFDAAQILWRHGAKINHLIAPKGGTPADWARANGSSEFIAWLKSIGAEESVIDP